MQTARPNCPRTPRSISRMPRYSPSSGNIAKPSPASMSVSDLRPRNFEDSALSITTAPNPIAMHERRKSSGSIDVFHSGCRRGPLSSISDPSDDWCIVGSSMPSATSHSRLLFRHWEAEIADPAEQGVGAGARPLEERRRQLEPQHDRVRHDAQGHFEQHRVQVPIPEERQLVGDPRSADIDHHRETGDGVAEGAGDQCGPDERVILSAVEDVHEQRHRVAATGSTPCR